MSNIDLWIERGRIWYCLDFWTDIEEIEEPLALRIELMEIEQ